MKLQNATVLITGAGGGFGQEFTRQCLAAGANLILTDLDAARLTAESGPGRVVQCISADLSTREGCAHLINEATRTPDILINNAGVATYGRFDEVPFEETEKLITVNLLGLMRVTHGFLPGMLQRGSGHIVNISSVAGWVGAPGLANYSASKFGVRGFSEALRNEYHRHGIYVTTVYPFYSRTPILEPPRFGTMEPPTGPESFVTDPAAVIRQVVRAIERDRAHVFPDRVAKLIHIIKRVTPRLVPILTGGSR